MNNNSNTADVYGHGTKCAGAAAAAGNNALGVSGVAMKTKIMPIRVTDTQGYGYSSAMASGIAWAADRGVRVASLSFRNVAGSSTIITAAQYMRNKGGVVVAAGGNTGGLLSLTPSSAITAVAATDSTDNRTSFSSYGTYIDVAAPGSGIWTTTNGGGYSPVSGTSFSTPITAGVYALMIAVNPKLSSSTLDSILFTTAVDRGAAGWDQYYGHGRVNAAAAVQKAKSTTVTDSIAPAVSISKPTGGTVSGLVPISVSATDNVGVTQVTLYVNGKIYASDITAPYAFSWSSSAYAGSSVQLQAKAVDAAGNVGASSIVKVSVASGTN
jgi:subtilisin family serine protease